MSYLSDESAANCANVHFATGYAKGALQCAERALTETYDPEFALLNIRTALEALNAVSNSAAYVYAPPF